ncbi:MAG: aminopeptidase [Bacteroidetes bacterium]|nr:aminopeptidase [Bacteroidota bacterium]
MIKRFLLPAFWSISCVLSAQKAEPFSFKEVKQIAATAVKNQERTGTCWAFSTASFLESEVLRMGKGDQNLSEMYVVRHIYRQKCENYVRRQGHAQFGEGGLAHDLLNAVKMYGIVPESAYPGRKDPSMPLNHAQLVSTLKSRCDNFIKQGMEGTLSANWMQEIDQALDDFFGPVPQKFKVNDVAMDPITYRDFLGIRPDDYVSISSYTHHPFYQQFILEVPDNFSNGSFYNLPLSEMMRSLNFAIQQGFTVEWDADVSNKGFSPQYALAIEPEKDWKDKTQEETAAAFKWWEPERNITQEYRQQLFDRQISTDDHLMHITGMLDETHSGIYYQVKNSWGEISDLKGYVRVSEAYMRANTISFTLHKDALPSDIRKRLGLEPGDVRIEGANGTQPIPARTKPSRNDPRVAPVDGKLPVIEKTTPRPPLKKQD